MSTRTSPWPAGTPSWADLGTPNVRVIKSFYAGVLGWTFQETEEEDDDYGGYAIATVNGAPVAGVGPLQEGAHNAWTLYFATDDLDKSASAVTENGGSILVDPGDVGPLGRMFIAADPYGAAFALWQAGTHIGAGMVNEPGALTWEDLRSPDPEGARAFYSALFGYSYDAAEDTDDDYRTFTLANAERPAGGIGGMTGAEGMPSHWVVYFAVRDIDGAIFEAENRSGTVLLHDPDTPYGQIAALADPTGAAFCVIQLPAS